MKASMDEKLNLVMTLKTSIDRARYIIDNANLYCFLITDCGWKPDYIWEILNSNVKDEIANKVINKWNQDMQVRNITKGIALYDDADNAIQLFRPTSFP